MEPFGAPHPVPSGLAGFVAGFSTPWTGVRYMNQHPRLWRHGILPVVCNLVLTVVVLAGLVFGALRAYGWLAGKFPPGWAWMILQILSGLALGVVILGVTIAVWLLLQGIFCGYFYSQLAREVEIQLGLDPAAMREVPLRYQINDAFRDLVVLAGVAGFCLMLNFVPVIGSLAATAIGGYFDCFVFGMDYLDYPQALRARSRKVQREFARRHRAVTLGLGASVMLISFVPILSSVLLTSAATGAVLLYRRLEPGAAAGTGVTKAPQT